jgi:hypothetical protein
MGHQVPDLCYDIVRITPVNLLNRIVGSKDNSAVPDGLSPTWVGCVVDPNIWGWNPPTRSGLCDGRGFTITVDPPEVLLAVEVVTYDLVIDHHGQRLEHYQTQECSVKWCP